jgi:L-iditol 2-dehydrogenase
MDRHNMWVARLVAPYTFQQESAPAPRDEDLAPGDVLLRILAGGLCGSDMPMFKGGLRWEGAGLQNGRSRTTPIAGAPLHEVVGEVVASHHPEITPGRLAVGWATGQDAIAEFVITRGDSLIEIDDTLPPALAVTIQSLACVLYAVERLGDTQGRSVAVIGQGPIGMLFGHVLKSKGACQVTGVDRVDRSDIAAAYGVDQAVQASADRWAADLTDESRPDIIIEAIGHQVSTMDSAVAAVADCGQVYFFGTPDDLVYPLPMHNVYRKALTIRSGTTRERRRMLAQARDHLAAHPQLAPAYVTDEIPLKDPQAAFDLAVVPKKGQLKVVLFS